MFKHGVEYRRPRCQRKHESSVWGESSVCKVLPNSSCASLSFSWTFSFVCAACLFSKAKSGSTPNVCQRRAGMLRLTCQYGFVRFELLPSHEQAAICEPGAFPQVTQVVGKLTLWNLQHVRVRLARYVYRVLDHTYLNKWVSGLKQEHYYTKTFREHETLHGTIPHRTEWACHQEEVR